MFNITNIFAFIVVAGLATPFVKFEDEHVVQADVDPYLKGFDSTNMDQAEPEVQMYYYIKKYSKQYDIPTKYAFSVAYIESLYRGPCDKNYKHNVTSYCGALGPMQIMPATAKLIYGKTVNKAQLKNDIDFNVKTSMMLLQILHNKYNNWGVVFGAYNTGKPYVNNYARRVLKKEYVWL